MPGEFELIDRYFARPRRGGAGGRGVVLGIGDDAALLELPPACDLVAAVDTIVAGRHFPPGTSPHAIGHRALAVNLSDLAAMGATPAWATLALTLPAAEDAWLSGFAAGLLDLADAHGVTLVGGDTTGGPLTISVQLLGHVPHGTALRRSGGRPGDLLAVTGTLGDSGAGLALATGRLQAPAGEHTTELLHRFEYPAARVAFGRGARGIASAAMDLSDGLTGDLPKLAAASGAAAHVEVARLPLSAALRDVASAQQARDWALAAGDDYELLLAVAPARWDELAALAAASALRLTAIGELRAGSGVAWTLHGAPYAAPAEGFDHFRGPSTQITV